MRLAAFWVVLLMMARAATVAAAAPPLAQAAPWIGTWQLDPARSTRSSSSPYKRVTLTIETVGDRLRVLYDMVGTRGGVTHLEWTGAFDGKDEAVQGADTTLTNAYRPLDDRRYAIDVKVEGVVVATAVAIVSPDGRTLTVTQREHDADGRAVTSTAVYRRL